MIHATAKSPEGRILGTAAAEDPIDAVRAARANARAFLISKGVNLGRMRIVTAQMPEAWRRLRS